MHVVCLPDITLFNSKFQPPPPSSTIWAWQQKTWKCHYCGPTLYYVRASAIKMIDMREMNRRSITSNTMVFLLFFWSTASKYHFINRSEMNKDTCIPISDILRFYAVSINKKSHLTFNYERKGLQCFKAHEVFSLLAIFVSKISDMSIFLLYI